MCVGQGFLEGPPSQGTVKVADCGPAASKCKLKLSEALKDNMYQTTDVGTELYGDCHTANVETASRGL